MVSGPLLAGVVIGPRGGFPVAYAIDAVLFTVGCRRVGAAPVAAAGRADRAARPGLARSWRGLRFIAASRCC